MSKVTAQRNFLKIAKNAALAIALVLGSSLAAKAEDTKVGETLQVSCNPFATNSINAQCSSNLTIETEAEQVAQTRRGRRRKSKVQGYYGGFSLGVGFPNGGIELTNSADTEFPDAEYSSSFIGSLFGGIKFTKNLSVDLEFLLGLGGLDTDETEDFTNDPDNNIDIEGDYEADGDYSAFAFYINPRFELPLTSNGKFSLYASPGIGISQTNVNFNSKDDAGERLDLDISTTGFAFQIKGGASYSISETLGVFGQLRYVSLKTDDAQFAFPDDLNLFSTELGMKFNF